MSSFTVDLTGVKELQAKLCETPKYLEMKTQELIDMLSEAGMNIANAYYMNAPYAGVNDVTVTKEVGRLTATVKATGNATLFIEFGTGLPENGMTEAIDAKLHLIDSDGLVSRGQYGLRRGRQKKGWYYAGTPGLNPPSGTAWGVKARGKVHTYGNPATPAMYDTIKDLEKLIQVYAKEVFG